MFVPDRGAGFKPVFFDRLPHLFQQHDTLAGFAVVGPKIERRWDERPLGSLLLAEVLLPPASLAVLGQLEYICHRQTPIRFNTSTRT
jgi:hypothetical protein